MEFQGGIAFRPVDAPVVLYEDEIMPVSEMRFDMRMTKMLAALREERRLKQNTDFAYTFKYGVLTMMCAEVYMDTLTEYAEKFHLTINKFLFS